MRSVTFGYQAFIVVLVAHFLANISAQIDIGRLLVAYCCNSDMTVNA